MKKPFILHPRTIISIFSLLLFIISAIIVTLIANGYVIDISKKKLEKTGIIVVNSEPKGSLIYLNDKLQNVTNATLANLIPDTYRLRLEKEGYTSWQKDIKVEENLVIEIEARLFPLNPSLTPVTLYGCYNPIANADGTQIIFEVRDNEEKNGIWVLYFNNLPLGKGYDLKQILKDSPLLNYSQADIFLSPDEKEILISLPLSVNLEDNYLYPLDQSTSPIKDTRSKTEILSKWQIEKQNLKQDKISTLPKEIQETIKDKELMWSPDQNRFYYENDSRLITFYNQETKEYITSNLKFSDYQQILWYADSNRIILLENYEENKSGKISIVEVDGQNKVSVYEGILMSKEIFISPNGRRLFFITNFNISSNTSPNLYYLSLD